VVEVSFHSMISNRTDKTQDVAQLRDDPRERIQ